MDMICTDKVFGEMKYNRRWFKDEYLSIFNKEYSIKIVAKAYSGKAITEQQRDSYSVFKANQDNYLKKIADLMLAYVNDNAESLSSIWSGAIKITTPNELSTIVKPTSLLIKQDGTTILLFDCQWDEHGVGVQVLPDFEIGSQDMFL